MVAKSSLVPALVSNPVTNTLDPSGLVPIAVALSIDGPTPGNRETHAGSRFDGATPAAAPNGMEQTRKSARPDPRMTRPRTNTRFLLRSTVNSPRFESQGAQAAPFTHACGAGRR